MVDALLRGSAYAVIVRDRYGNVAELWPSPPEAVAVELDPETLAPIYRVGDAAGRQRVYDRSEILHLRGIGARHYVGKSPVMLENREAIALSISLEDHAARFFANGARPSGVLETQRQLSADARTLLRESFQARHSGENSAGIVVLEEGMKFTPAAFDGGDSQFHEMRKFQFAEIARIFRRPHRYCFRTTRRQ